MNNKKAKIIIAILIFIFLGLIIFAFASPNDEDGENLDNRVKQGEVDKKPSKETENKTDSEDETEKERNTEKEAKAKDDSYDKAKALVETAEKSLTKEDVEAAKKAIGEVTKGTDTKELEDRIAAVESDINAKDLVDALAKLVEEAENTDGIGTAREFNTENEVEAAVEAVNNEELKAELEEALEEILAVINDKTAPKVNVEAKATKENVTIDVEDDTEVTIKLNDKEVENGTEVTEEGKYTLTVTDEAFNETVVEFVIDKTAPDVTGVKEDSFVNTDVEVEVDDLTNVTATLDEEEFNLEDAITTEGEHTLVVTDEAGNATTVTFTIDKTAPTVDITDGRIFNCSLTAVITDENFDKATLNGVEYTTNKIGVTAEGKYTLVMYDKAGNTSTIKFSVDKTAPTLNTSAYGVAGKEGLIIYVTNNDTINVTGFISEKLQKAPKMSFVVDDTTYELSSVQFAGANVGNAYWFLASAQITNPNGTEEENQNKIDLKNGEIQIILSDIVDLAGNKTDSIVIEYKDGEAIIVDRTAPVITVKDSSVGDNERKIYSQIDFQFSDNVQVAKTITNGITVTRTPDTGMSQNFSNYSSLYVEGENTVEIYDAAGNKATFTFTLDTVAPQIKAANIYVSGDPNEQSVFYATKGDKIVAYIRATEELKTPVFELVSGENTYSMGKVTVTGPDANGEYTYQAIYTVNDAELADGEVTLKVSNVSDFAGNALAVITRPTNGHRIIVDKTAPTVDIADGRHFSQNLAAVITDSNFDKATLNNVEYTTSTIGVSENGTYELVMYDKAGNSSSITFYVDKNLSTAYLTYSTEELTSESVTVTITAYETLAELTGWVLSADKKSLSKEFTNNEIGSVTINSEDGDSKEFSYNVSNIYSEVATEEALKTAVAATGNNIVKITENITLTENLVVNAGTSLVLDLNGKELTAYNDSNKRIVIEGNVIIKNGKITDGTEYENGVSNGTVMIKLNNNGSLTINADATVEGSYNIIWPSANSKLVVKGTVISNNGGPAILTNGSSVSGATITIESGAVVTSNNDAAIYLPSGNLIVNGGTITGATGIAVKGGNVTINGGEINGNGTDTEFTHYNNGWINTGDAFAVENCNYISAPAVVTINGGKFNSVNGEAIASYIESTSYARITGFVKGGYLSNEIDSTLIQFGYKQTEDNSIANYVAKVVEQ